MYFFTLRVSVLYIAVLKWEVFYDAEKGRSSRGPFFPLDLISWFYGVRREGGRRMWRREDGKGLAKLFFIKQKNLRNTHCKSSVYEQKNK